MIEKGTDLIKELGKKYYKLDVQLKQLNFLDTRVYEREEGLYYPSVTSILQYMPKGKWFEEWIKDVGHNADIIRNRAGQEGTEVHNAVEQLIKGEELEWMDEYGRARYSLKVWEMIVKFAEFWTTYKPEPVLIEQFLYSDKYHYAGTTDLVVKLDGSLCLLDIKTSNFLSRSHHLQLAAYAQAYEEIVGDKIEKTGVLWLKSTKRTEGKKEGVYQGKGWEISFVDDVEKAFKEFLLIYEVYKLEHQDIQPKFNTYPTTLKL